MTDTIRWGIIGTGAIAKAFAHAVSLIPDATLVAVGSRRQSTADEFGQQFGIPRCYPTYEALVADPDVDAVYISTPHTFHKENTLLCLEAGKAILCEKPFALNAADSQIMADAARERGVFLMEAMWTRFLPATLKLHELLEQNIIGELRYFQADFGFQVKAGPEGRLLNPALGGGALLDIGIYPITFAMMLFGQPESVVSAAQIGETGVDVQFGAMMQFAGERQAHLSSTFLMNTPQEAYIGGTEGYIRVYSPFYKTERLTVKRHHEPPQDYHLPVEGSGYRYEAEEVGRCLREGLTESPRLPLDETLRIMRVLDAMRQEWGFFYPGENMV